MANKAKPLSERKTTITVEYKYLYEMESLHFKSLGEYINYLKISINKQQTALDQISQDLRNANIELQRLKEKEDQKKVEELLAAGQQPQTQDPGVLDG